MKKILALLITCVMLVIVFSSNTVFAAGEDNNSEKITVTDEEARELYYNNLSLLDKEFFDSAKQVGNAGMCALILGKEEECTDMGKFKDIDGYRIYSYAGVKLLVYNGENAVFYTDAVSKKWVTMEEIYNGYEQPEDYFKIEKIEGYEPSVPLETEPITGEENILSQNAGFIEAAEAYHTQENVSALDSIQVNEIKNHITVFSEDENTVIFGSELLEITEIDGEIVPEYEDINGYRFTSNGFFSVSNPTGYCVYDKAQNKVYGIADAVKEDIVAVETLAEVIPGTTQKTQPVSTEPVVTQPSDTAPVDTTPIATDPVDTGDTTPSDATTAPTEAPTTAPTEASTQTPTQTTQPTQAPATAAPAAAAPATQAPTAATSPAASEKKDNTLTVKAKKVTVKANKKTTLNASKYVKVSKAVGKVTYKLVKGNKKITIAKNGKLTIKKGLKKGTYTIKVKVTAAGNANFYSASKTVSVKINVK